MGMFFSFFSCPAHLNENSIRFQWERQRADFLPFLFLSDTFQWNFNRISMGDETARFNGVSMEFQWDFNGISMGDETARVNGISMGFQWDFNGISMGDETARFRLNASGFELRALSSGFRLQT